MKKITITIEEDEDKQMIPWTWDNWGKQQGYVDPCANCSNNPINNPHASGMCNCALPALCNPIYC